MNSNYDRPQRKFLEEMYDDFFSLISSEPDAFDIAKEKIRQLRYNHESTNKFENIKSRDEYLKRANSRHAEKRKEATSYFNEDEPSLDYSKIKKEAAKKASTKQTEKANSATEKKSTTSSKTTNTSNVEKTKVEKIEEIKLSKEEIAAQKVAKLEEF